MKEISNDAYTYLQRHLYDTLKGLNTTYLTDRQKNDINRLKKIGRTLKRKRYENEL